MLAVAPVVGCGTGSVRTDVVIVNAGEPQNPLIPTNTNDSNGGRIIDRLFAGLMSYDDKGTLPRPNCIADRRRTACVGFASLRWPCCWLPHRRPAVRCGPSVPMW